LVVARYSINAIIGYLLVITGYYFNCFAISFLAIAGHSIIVSCYFGFKHFDFANLGFIGVNFIVTDFNVIGPNQGHLSIKIIKLNLLRIESREFCFSSVSSLYERKKDI
jgi:hypothetical protein